MATDPTRDGQGERSDPLTAEDDLQALTRKAQRCRRLAAGISDRQAAEVLTSLAKTYEAAAEERSPRD